LEVGGDSESWRRSCATRGRKGRYLSLMSTLTFCSILGLGHSALKRARACVTSCRIRQSSSSASKISMTESSSKDSDSRLSMYCLLTCSFNGFLPTDSIENKGTRSPSAIAHPESYVAGVSATWLFVLLLDFSVEVDSMFFSVQTAKFNELAGNGPALLAQIGQVASRGRFLILAVEISFRCRHGLSCLATSRTFFHHTAETFSPIAILLG